MISLRGSIEGHFFDTDNATAREYMATIAMMMQTTALFPSSPLPKSSSPLHSPPVSAYGMDPCALPSGLSAHHGPRSCGGGASPLLSPSRQCMPADRRPWPERSPLDDRTTVDHVIGYAPASAILRRLPGQGPRGIASGRYEVAGFGRDRPILIEASLDIWPSPAELLAMTLR